MYIFLIIKEYVNEWTMCRTEWYYSVGIGTGGRVLMDVEGWGSRMVAEEGKTRATDFSIAAIMARSAEQRRSPVASSPPCLGKIGLPTGTLGIL